MDQIVLPSHTRELAAADDVQDFLPDERRDIARTLFTPDDFRLIEQDRASEQPFTLRSVIVILLLFTGMAWVAARFLPLPFVSEEGVVLVCNGSNMNGNARKMLSDAIELYNNGNSYAAIDKLADEVDDIVNARDVRRAAEAQMLLEQYWLWCYGENPSYVKNSALAVLSFAPDNLAAKAGLARTLPQTMLGLEQVPDNYIHILVIDGRRVVRYLSPLVHAENISKMQKNVLMRMLAMGNLAIWVGSGYGSRPEDPGFAEREKALELCDIFEYPDLRYNILDKIWNQSWSNWPPLTRRIIGGEKLTRSELKDRIDQIDPIYRRRK